MKGEKTRTLRILSVEAQNEILEQRQVAVKKSGRRESSPFSFKNYMMKRMVEHCPGIAEVKGRIPYKPEFFSGFLFATANVAYRIYSINRPGGLLNFWTLKVGAYSRLGAY